MNADDRQTLVDVAKAQHEGALAYLERAEYPYRLAISVLEDAMDGDPTVTEARLEVDETGELYDSARGIAKENQEK